MIASKTDLQLTKVNCAGNHLKLLILVKHNGALAQACKFRFPTREGVPICAGIVKRPSAMYSTKSGLI